MNGSKQYLVLSELYLPLRGGHVVWMHEVCRRMGGVHLLTGKSGDLSKRENVDGIDVHRIRLGRIPLLRPESLPLYANLFLRGLLWGITQKPKAIISARILPEGVVANAISRMTGIPDVVFAHGEEINRLRWDKPLPQRRRMTVAFKRRFLWRAYRKADLIIANSNFTSNLLIEGGISPDKIAVVHPGTDPERFKPEPRDEALQSKLDLKGKKVILSLGRLTPRKGQDMTIEALPDILKHVPDAIYVIGGRGEYQVELRQLAKSVGVESKVRFLGEVDEELLPKLYNLADVFIMPNQVMPGSNDVEGFGIVFLEAGACEVPVIGGRSGGVVEAIEDGKTGLLVDGASQSSIAEAVIRILTDEDLAQSLGRQGRERICRQLTWDHSAESIKGLIDNLADDNDLPQRHRETEND